MSYDLFFTYRPNAAKPGIGEFRKFFSARPCYEVTEKQATYRNEDTGVSCDFDLVAGEGDHAAAFNLNYFRPHVFALEAAIEVAAFIKEFDLTVEDPQVEGMGVGEFSVDGMIRGWNCGNELAYKAALTVESRPETVYVLPRGEIDSIWRWNFKRNSMQEKLGDDILVPKILFAAEEGQVRTMIAWADAIPACLPRVDYVTIPRKRLAPSRWLRRQEDTCLLAWGDLKPVMKHFKPCEGHRPYMRAQYEKAPEEVVDFVKELLPATRTLEGMAFESILDKELVEKVRK